MGDTLLIYPCQQVFPAEIFYDHKVDNKCYEFLPIKIGRNLMFASPQSADVTPVADEIVQTYLHQLMKTRKVVRKLQVGKLKSWKYTTKVFLSKWSQEPSTRALHQ